MTQPPLELAWSLPQAWFLVPLDGDLDAAVTAALDERAARDPDARAAHPDLRDLLTDYGRGARADGAVAALVRWEVGSLGELVTAYATLERYERPAGPAEREISARLAELQAERPEDHRPPVVERVVAGLGPGLRRAGVVALPADATAALRPGPDRPVAPHVAQLALSVEVWLWVDATVDLLRFDLWAFQVAHAALIGEELDAIVGSLALARDG